MKAHLQSNGILVTTPKEASIAMITLKERYYQHIATSTSTINKIVNSNEQPDGTLDNEQTKYVRFIASEKPGGLSSVVSSHPVTFTNCLFLDQTNIAQMTTDSVKRSLQIFDKLQLSARLAVCGVCENKQEFDHIRNILELAGMKCTKTGSACMLLSIVPRSTSKINQHTKSTELTVKAPPGFSIQEIQTGDIKLIAQWGNVVATSYGFPAIKIRGKTTAEHFGLTYQNVQHGHSLRQFVCLENKSGDVCATSTLFCDRKRNPMLGGVFNICVVKKYRKQKGLHLGTLMTQLVISEAQQMGCQQMILQASPLGRPVYERMGFLHMVDEFAGDFAGGAESILTKMFKAQAEGTRPAPVSTLADQLFGMFERGEFEASVALFAEDAEIRQLFDPKKGAMKSISVPDFAAAMVGLVAKVGAPKYRNRRVSTFDGGFVEQHTSELAHPTLGTLLIEACLVAKVNADGKITLLEEYLDPATATPAATPEGAAAESAKTKESTNY